MKKLIIIITILLFCGTAHAWLWFNAEQQTTTKIDIINHDITTDISDVYKDVHTNKDSTTDITLNLPKAVRGMDVMIILDVSQDIDINPADADQIIVETDHTGDAISSDAVRGSFIELLAVDGTSDVEWWIPVRTQGTWTDVN